MAGTSLEIGQRKKIPFPWWVVPYYQGRKVWNFPNCSLELYLRTLTHVWSYKSIFKQKFKILHIFRGLCIISTFRPNFCTTNKVHLWYVSMYHFPSLRFQLHSHFLNWQWSLEGYIWEIKSPANRILLPWKINRSVLPLVEIT